MTGFGIVIYGVWIRNDGTNVVVCVERAVGVGQREWCRVYQGPAEAFGVEGEVSRIVEPLGIERATRDEIGEEFERVTVEVKS